MATMAIKAMTKEPEGGGDKGAEGGGGGAAWRREGAWAPSPHGGER